MDFLTAWWTNAAWRDDFLRSAIRELSKTGSLGCHIHVFQELAIGLNREEALWLFSQLQTSQRVSLEWQEEFLAVFPQVMLFDLPIPDTDEEAAFQRSVAEGEDATRRSSKAENDDYVRHSILPEPEIPF